MKSLHRLLIAVLAGYTLLAPGVWAETAQNQEDTPDSSSTASLSGSFLSGRFAKEHGDRSNAIRYLEEAQAKDPGNSAISGQLLVLTLEGGNMAAAVERARELESVKGHEPLVDLVLAVDAVKQDDLEEASSRFKKVFSFSERALWAPLFNAWVDFGRGKLKKAIKPADILPAGQSAPAFLAYQLALVNDVAGFTSVARQQYEMSTADHLKAPFRAVEAAADFFRRQGDDERLAQLKMDYMAAHPDATGLVTSENASNVKAIMRQGDDDEKSGGRLVENTQEGVAEVLFTMASVLYSAEAQQDTLLYLRMALYLRPDFPLGQLLMGSVLEDEKRFTEAATVYGSVSPKSPLYERAILRQAYMIEQQGHLDEALSMLEKRADGNPEDYEAYVAKGDLLREHDRYEDAARAYTQAIDRIKQPTERHWGIFFARGVCLERLSQWDRSEADLRKALSLSHDQPEVLNYLGYSLLVRDRDLEDAKQMIEKAYSLQPTAPYIIDSMGWVLYKSGDLDGAVQRLEQAIEQMPGDATVNEHLGDAYWQVGRRMEARYQWERALSSSPEPEQEKNIRRKLKDGLPPLVSKPHDHAQSSAAQHVSAESVD